MSYIKNHDPWTNDHPITGRAMNRLESQWTSIKALIDVHNHDERYYSKEVADTKFFSTDFFQGADADTLDGLHLADIITTVMPVGAIMAWPGTDADVPEGWYVCDGASHHGHVTMNLIDYFVIGAGDAYDTGDVVGAPAWDSTIPPTGSITVGDHTLTLEELPVHSHHYTEKRNVLAVWLPTSGIFSKTVYQEASYVGEQAIGGGIHNHTSGSSITFKSIDPRPAYRALYFIEKCE